MGFNALAYPMCIFIAVGNGCLNTSMHEYFLAEDCFFFFTLRKLGKESMIYAIF